MKYEEIPNAITINNKEFKRINQNPEDRYKLVSLLEEFVEVLFDIEGTTTGIWYTSEKQ